MFPCKRTELEKKKKQAKETNPTNDINAPGKNIKEQSA